MTMLKMRPEKYNVTLTTLSPLHIGTGKVLRRGFDYVTDKKGKTWVANQDAFAELLYTEGSFDKMAQGIPLSQLVNDQDFNPDNGLWRYILDGIPGATSHGAEVREQIKDIWDRPYIPGSSLKGAIRTALMSIIFGAKKLNWTASQFGTSAKNAAKGVESQIFGSDPNHDVLRALQVSDSQPDDARRLVMLNLIATKTSDGSGDNAPITIEAVPPQSKFSLTITLDAHLLSAEIAPSLGFDDAAVKRLSARLPKVINAWTKNRLSSDEDRPRAGQWREQFVRMANDALNAPETDAILQLGWGAGWDSKTLGYNLTDEHEEFTRLVNRFSKEMLFQGKAKHQTGGLYPKTRRVRLTGADLPIKGELGWVHLRFERVE